MISSGGSAASMALARSSGADHVFNYRTDDVDARIAGLTNGEGVDLVFDSSDSDTGFADTARMVRTDATWCVLGVGRGNTTRRIETASRVDDVLAQRGARHVNVNLLRYFPEPGFRDSEGEALLQSGMRLAAQRAVEGKVVPHIAGTLEGTASSISRGLSDMARGAAAPGRLLVAL